MFPTGLKPAYFRPVLTLLLFSEPSLWCTHPLVVLRSGSVPGTCLLVLYEVFVFPTVVGDGPDLWVLKEKEGVRESD